MSIFVLVASAGSLDWQDPEVFRINKEPARSSFYSYDDADRRIFQNTLGSSQSYITQWTVEI
jgi:hypothetical protein